MEFFFPNLGFSIGSFTAIFRFYTILGIMETRLILDRQKEMHLPLFGGLKHICLAELLQNCLKLQNEEKAQIKAVTSVLSVYIVNRDNIKLRPV